MHQRTKIVSQKISYQASPSFNQRRMIECLRMGIVPNNCIKEFTFGRDDEINFLSKWLNDSSQKQTVFIEAEYGSGKSHLISWLIEYALSNGYAVGFAELDPNEAPIQKPKKIYSLLLKSLKVILGDRIHDFFSLMDELSNADFYFEKNRYLQAYQRLKHQFHRTEFDLEGWIVGDSLCKITPSLYDHATAANIYCNILSSISIALKNELNKKGLLLILDEAENYFSSWVTKQQKDKGLNFLSGLILLSNNDRRLMKEHLENDDNRYRGKNTGLLYHARACDIRYAESLPSYVKLVAAFTEVVFKENQHFERLKLKPLSDKAKEKIAKYIFESYKKAYSIDFYPGILSDLLKKNINVEPTRMFIKSIVEGLDIRRFHQ
ncbi:MAG: BREX system ATP-binding domain-containing protein [Candidatus Methanosuratincola petrocarbonis]